MKDVKGTDKSICKKQKHIFVMGLNQRGRPMVLLPPHEGVTQIMMGSVVDDEFLHVCC